MLSWVGLLVPAAGSTGSLLLLAATLVLLLVLDACQGVFGPAGPKREPSRARVVRRPSRGGKPAAGVRMPSPWSKHLRNLEVDAFLGWLGSAMYRLACRVRPFGMAALLAFGFLLSLQELGQGIHRLPDLPLTVEQWQARQALARGILAGALQPAVYGVLFWGVLALLRHPLRRLAASTGS
jgi:hypothetical protein